jgi:hypothetical protein
MSHTELVKYNGACLLGAPDLPGPKHVKPSIGDLSGEPDAHTVISQGGGTSQLCLGGLHTCAAPRVHHIKLNLHK